MAELRLDSDTMLFGHTDYLMGPCVRRDDGERLG
jgi:hypothetical protein